MVASADGPHLDLKLRRLDDHYAKSAAETRQLVQQALAATRQAPSAAALAEVKTSVTRLEAQVTRLMAASARTEGALAGMTARVQDMEKAAIEKAAEDTAAVAPPLQPADRQPPAAPAGPPQDPTEVSFMRALEALQGPSHASEPLRIWLEVHPMHPRVAEGYLQLGLLYLNQHYPVAARYYFKRILTEFPMTLQAQEAKAMLETIEPTPPPTPAKTPKKVKKAVPTSAVKPTGVPSVEGTGKPGKPDQLPSVDLPKLPAPSPSMQKRPLLVPPLAGTPSKGSQALEPTASPPVSSGSSTPMMPPKTLTTERPEPPPPSPALTTPAKGWSKGRSGQLPHD